MTEDTATLQRTDPQSENVGPADPGPAHRTVGSSHLAERITLTPGAPGPDRDHAAELIAGRNFEISAHAELAPGDAGVLISHGDGRGGYLVAIGTDSSGDPFGLLTFNAYGRAYRCEPLPLRPGDQQLTMSVYTRPLFRWDITFTDWESVVTLRDVPQLRGDTPVSGIRVGSAPADPVDGAVGGTVGRHYSGLLHTVTITPGPRTSGRSPSGPGPSTEGTPR